MLTDSILVESRSARDEQLSSIDSERALEIVNKAKALVMATYQGTGIATTEQLAAYYEVPADTVKKALSRSRDEFESDGLREIKGKELEALSSIGSDITSPTQNVTRLNAWTPKSALRLGMVLRDSAIAKQIRNLLLNAAVSGESFRLQPGESFTPQRSLPQEMTPTAKFRLAEAKSRAVARILKQANIPPVLISQYEINYLSKICPDDRDAFEPARQLLLVAAPQEEQDFIPSELATRLTELLGRKVGAREVNSILQSSGLQYRKEKPDKEWEWDLTERGKEYGKVYLITSTHNKHQGGQIRWSPKVVEVLKESLLQIAG